MKQATTQIHNQGLFAGIVAVILALVSAAFGVRLDPAQQTAVLVAAGFVVSALLAAFHVAASAAETAGLPAADFHSQAYWMGLISALATVAVLVFRVPLTPSQVHLLLSAAGIVVALILGTGHVGASVARAARTAEVDRGRIEALTGSLMTTLNATTPKPPAPQAPEAKEGQVAP